MSDPTGFIRQHQAAIIDEIQRAPELILALKEAVDEDPRPGRFLITGSVNLFAAVATPDSLAGRVETIELLPFSQSEIARTSAPQFLSRAFSGDFPSFQGMAPSQDLIDRVLSGGYPEAIARAQAARRVTWLLNYLSALVRKDIPETSGLSRQGDMARLVSRASLASGQLLNLSRIASEMHIDGKTSDRWLRLLEHLFVVRRVPAWHSNELKRLIKTPKLHFLDSGLLAAVRRIDKETLLKDRRPLGMLLECFVFAELQKAIALHPQPILVSHYRDKDKVEVDFVLESLAGSILAVEVKASATVRSEDFKGLRRLRDAARSDFTCGILLHDGDRIHRVEDRLFAMPVSMLWKD